MVLLLVLFRAQSFEDAVTCWEIIFSFDLDSPFVGNANVMGKTLVVFILGVTFDLYLRYTKIDLEKLGGKMSLSMLALVIILVIMLMVLYSSSTNSFIYFKF